MKPLRWSESKDEKLRKERGVGFQDVEKRLAEGEPLEVVVHPNPRKYPIQKFFVLDMAGYVYKVPFVESSEEIFLKTIIPDRKLRRRHGGGKA